jgi:arylsulfatase A-like enzyme
MIALRHLGLAHLALAGAGALGAPPAARPNLVVILADDLNSHYPGFNGGPVATPHLDRLAREGTALKQFYVHAVCSPTRSAFLTGRYPFRNGMEERAHGNDTAGLLPDERTLGEALRAAGYDTALIGKWHLGNWYQRQLPLQRGFDYHYGLYGALVSYYQKVRERTYDWHRNGEPVREDGYTTDLFAREFERLIAARTPGRPFFYYAAFNATHGPDEAPAALVEKYRQVVARDAGDARPSLREFRALKYAMLESLDTAIGRLLAALEKKGLRENTLIVFFNDNGGRHENLPYRGGKGDTYEGGVRVPCLFHWPGRIPAGQTLDGLACAADLYPTLLKLAGGSLEQPLPLDGLDLWPMLTRQAASPRTEVVLGLPGDDVDTGEMALRQGPWKLVGRELYNLDSDPGEKSDLAARHPDIHRRLQARLEQLVAERRPPEPHLRIPARPLLVFGEKENANPPSWLQPYLDALPDSARAKRKNKKK